MGRQALLHYDQCPYKKRKLRYKQIQREDNVETQEKPSREASE